MFFNCFNAIYLKANDPITKRALWIREQRMGGHVWRWVVATDPKWDVPRIYFPPPAGEGQGEGGAQVISPSPQPSPDGRGGLYWDNPGQPLRLMPSWMYWLPFTTKYESPYWNGRVSGTLEFPNAETWQLTHWPAQQGHLWGRQMAREWAWAHGNCFQEDHTAAFELLTSGNRTVLCLKSQQFNYVANRFSTLGCTQHEITDTHWNWTHRHNDIVIAGQFRLGYAEMAVVDYPTPQGDTRRCRNTKVGCGQIEVSRGGEPLMQLTAHDTLAWERVA